MDFLLCTLTPEVQCRLVHRNHVIWRTKITKFWRNGNESKQPYYNIPVCICFIMFSNNNTHNEQLVNIKMSVTWNKFIDLCASYIYCYVHFLKDTRIYFSYYDIVKQNSLLVLCMCLHVSQLQKFDFLPLFVRANKTFSLWGYLYGLSLF